MQSENLVPVPNGSSSRSNWNACRGQRPGSSCHISQKCRSQRQPRRSSIVANPSTTRTLSGYLPGYCYPAAASLDLAHCQPCVARCHPPLLCLSYAVAAHQWMLILISLSSAGHPDTQFQRRHLLAHCSSRQGHCFDPTGRASSGQTCC